uniref:Uncharacterized protein n=1 Tax=Helianthus annuus TaxID=4232 RepID=A0A251UWC4_HELAN
MLRCSIKCLYQIVEEIGFVEQKTALYFPLVIRGFFGLEFGAFGVMSTGDFLNFYFSKLKFPSKDGMVDGNMLRWLQW